MRTVRIISVLLCTLVCGVAFSEGASSSIFSVANKLNHETHRSESSKVDILSQYLGANYDQQSLERLKDQFNGASSADTRMMLEDNRAKHQCSKALKEDLAARKVGGEVDSARMHESAARKIACEKTLRKEAVDQHMTPGNLRSLARKILASS